MSWKNLLCPLASITCNLFLLSLIDEQILPWLYFSVQQIVLSYRKYPEKSKCRLHLSTEVHSNVTPGASSADLRATGQTLLCCWEGTCSLRASCHKLLPLLHPSGQEMTRVKQMLVVKNASTEGRLLSAISNGLGSLQSLTCHAASGNITVLL